MPGGVALGVIAAVCWGVADFCARGATRLAGTFWTLITVQVIAVLALALAAAPFGLIRLQGQPVGLLLGAAGINLVILGGAFLLYRAFAIGPLALVSPVAASYAAITALLALVISGERLDALRIGGIALTLVGVVWASAAPMPGLDPTTGAVVKVKGNGGRWRMTPGLSEALIATVIFGVMYWALRYVTPQLGGVTVAFIGKVADLLALTVLLVGVTLARGRRGAPLIIIGEQPRRSGALWRAPLFWAYVAPLALLDSGANIAYNVGVAGALTAVVATLSSLFSAVTTLLAWIFLRERLTRSQWLGALVILVGVALVSGL